MGLFAVCAAAQLVTGWSTYNDELGAHGRGAITLGAVLAHGPSLGSALRELGERIPADGGVRDVQHRAYQRGSPESRRPGAVELVDADPRRFAGRPDVPWPVKRGGWVLRVYEYSLGLALFVLFLGSWIGHGLGGWRAFAAAEVMHGHPDPTLTEYLTSQLLLVRVVPELAERVPVGGGDGVAGRLSAHALVAGIETGARAAPRDRPLTLRRRASVTPCLSHRPARCLRRSRNTATSAGVARIPARS